MPSAGKMAPGNRVVSAVGIAAAGSSSDVPRGPLPAAPADNAMPSAGEMAVGNRVVSTAGTAAVGGSSSEPCGPCQMAPAYHAVPSAGEMAAGNRVVSAAGTAAEYGSSGECRGPLAVPWTSGADVESCATSWPMVTMSRLRQPTSSCHPFSARISGGSAPLSR
ncbi:unnamed protein product [Lampetra planeri]